MNRRSAFVKLPNFLATAARIPVVSMPNNIKCGLLSMWL